MDISTPPSLDLACPQAKTESKNMSTCLEREVSIKTKYGHRSIMHIIITTTNFNIKLYHISFPFTFICIFYFPIYIIKIPKIFILLSLSVLTFASYREGIENPFIALVVRFLFVCVGAIIGDLCVPRTGLIPWFLTEGNTYFYFAASPFPLQGKNQRKLKR